MSLHPILQLSRDRLTVPHHPLKERVILSTVVFVMDFMHRTPPYDKLLEVIDSHMESIKTLYPKAYEETLEELKKYTKKDLQ